MPIEVAKDYVCLISSTSGSGGTDLSDHVRDVNLQYGAEGVDDTVMGNDTRSVIAGLKEWSLEVEFAQDYDASKVDATLFPLVGAVAFEVTVRNKSGAVSATNPNFYGNVILESYPPLAGEVGGLATTRAVFRPAGDLTRAVA